MLRLEGLLASGRAAGADLVEIFLERTDHLGVLAEQDTITSVSPAFGMGAGDINGDGTRDLAIGDWEYGDSTAGDTNRGGIWFSLMGGAE